jgi:hypothetical protein
MIWDVDQWVRHVLTGVGLGSQADEGVSGWDIADAILLSVCF